MFILVQDLRYAARQLLKDRTVAAVLVLTIALGIGVNTAVFSMLNGFLRPLPVKAPGELVVLAVETKGDDTGIRFQFSYPAFDDFRKHNTAFSGIFATSEDIDG